MKRTINRLSQCMEFIPPLHQMDDNPLSTFDTDCGHGAHRQSTTYCDSPRLLFLGCSFFDNSDCDTPRER